MDLVQNRVLGAECDVIDRLSAGATPRPAASSAVPPRCVFPTVIGLPSFSSRLAVELTAALRTSQSSAEPGPAPTPGEVVLEHSRQSEADARRPSSCSASACRSCPSR